MTSREEIEAQHRKELKALDGEKRATLKKTKSTAGKGKKAKEALASVEAEFDTKLKELQKKQEEELSALDGSNAAAATTDADATKEEEPTAPAVTEETEEERKIRQKKEKARKKREKQKEKERERELEIEEANKNAGPSMKVMEMQQIVQLQLNPLNMQIVEVAADGHCLYRAIAAQLNRQGNGKGDYDYPQIRNLCAESLKEHEDEFAPFCESDDGFDPYVERVRSSADWGGHVELRAISTNLKKKIIIYQQQTQQPLVIEPIGNPPDDSDEPIRLSYHLHYYALGEHYNHVTPIDA